MQKSSSNHQRFVRCKGIKLDGVHKSQVNALKKCKWEEVEHLDKSQQRVSILTVSPWALIRWWERCDQQQCGRVEACVSASCVKQTSPAFLQRDKKKPCTDLADNKFKLVSRSENGNLLLLLNLQAGLHFRTHFPQRAGSWWRCGHSSCSILTFHRYIFQILNSVSAGLRLLLRSLLIKCIF